MQLGMIGLGRMGAAMVQRLQKGGHDCVVFDVDSSSVGKSVREGATGAVSLDDLVAKLKSPRTAWTFQFPRRCGLCRQGSVRHAA